MSAGWAKNSMSGNRFGSSSRSRFKYPAVGPCGVLSETRISPSAVPTVTLALSDSVTVGTADGEILVSLNTPHGPTAGYLKRLRDELPKRFPDMEFFAQPADIVSQILNFGLPAPIDIQVTGPLPNAEKNYEVATQIAAELRGVPGAVDVHVQQILDAPRIRIDADRALALETGGLTQRDVANSVLVSLSGTGATTTNFWLNYDNGVSYQVVVQTQ